MVGGGFHGFGVQLAGMLITIAWVAVTMTIIFQVIKHTMGLRVSAEEEIQGLDVKEHGLGMVSDTDALQKTVEEVIAANPQSVADYKAGKQKAIGFLVGQTMKAMKGKANPTAVNEILVKLLNE